MGLATFVYHLSGNFINAHVCPDKIMQWDSNKISIHCFSIIFAMKWYDIGHKQRFQPRWKMWKSDWIIIPAIGENENMFQTTNQKRAAFALWNIFSGCLAPPGHYHHARTAGAIAELQNHRAAARDFQVFQDGTCNPWVGPARWLSGWWLSLPLWKIWKSNGMMKFPILWKNKKCLKPPTKSYTVLILVWNKAIFRCNFTVIAVLAV